MNEAVRGALQGPLDELAARVGHFIHLSVLPVTGSPKQRRSYYQTVLDRLDEIAASGPGRYHLIDDAFTMAVVHEAEEIDGESSTISVFVSDGGSAALTEQLSAAMERAWEKKLGSQLPPAKVAGFWVLLLLDMIPAPDQRTPPQYLVTGSTVAQALRPPLSRHPGVVDEVWLRKGDGTYEPVPAWVAP